jgi:hypothetical protein
VDLSAAFAISLSLAVACFDSDLCIIQDPFLDRRFTRLDVAVYHAQLQYHSTHCTIPSYQINDIIGFFVLPEGPWVTESKEWSQYMTPPER